MTQWNTLEYVRILQTEQIAQENAKYIGKKQLCNAYNQCIAIDGAPALSDQGAGVIRSEGWTAPVLGNKR